MKPAVWSIPRVQETLAEMTCCRSYVRILVVGLVLFVGSAGRAALAVPAVAVSIKPVHALVAGVMAGIGTPELVIVGAGTPHGAALKPSQSRIMRNADIVFWVGPELETGLAKSLSRRGARLKTVALSRAEGVLRLKLRLGGTWPTMPSGDGAMAPGGSGAFDPHIWLSPANAVAMVRAIADTLAGSDPANAVRYEANAEALRRRLRRLDGALDELLAPVRTVPYMVFHDAYQYFERHYRLAAAGALAVNPERKPGARRILEARRLLREARVRCLFGEPQYAPALVSALVRGTNVRTAMLDPLGAGIATGPDAYFIMMRNLAAALKSCLARAP